MHKNKPFADENTIDIRELFSILKRRKKLIWSITGLITLLALIYVLVATPWWEANATLEIGKYTDKKTGKVVYLEKGQGVSERLKIKYIDIYKHVKNRDSKIKSIKSSKKNPQFISVSALGKSNTLALTEINKVINDLQDTHQKIIDEIIAKKKSELDAIERSIIQIEKYKLTDITEEINYIKKVNLPTINKKIVSIKAEMDIALKQKQEATKNLSSLSGNNASLAALRLAQIQGLEDKISSNKIKLISMNSNKEKILTSTLPSLHRKLEELKQISLVSLEEKRKLIELSMQPHNYHNTAIIAKLVTQDKPVKPKKVLILIVTFITGLMLSIFLAFFLEFINDLNSEEI